MTIGKNHFGAQLQRRGDSAEWFSGASRNALYERMLALKPDKD